MIDSIYIENFRRIVKAYIPLRDGITVLSGNNGVGKSTIIEALLFNQYGKPKDGTSKDSIPRSNRAEGELAYTSVDFTHGGLHYRCRRYITAKGTTMATLYSYTDEEYDRLMQQTDIRHLDKKLGTEVASSTTGVNAAISQLVGLDCTGYKASLVATQKELDSLSSLTKEKRKQFFLDLLGYSRLDKVRHSAASELFSKSGMRDGMMRQSYDPKELSKRLNHSKAELSDVQARYDKGMTLLTDMQDRKRAADDAYAKAQSDYDRVMHAVDENAADEVRKTQLEADRNAIQETIDANAKVAADYDATSTYAERLAKAKERLSKARAYDSTKAEVDRLHAAIEDDRTRLADIDGRVAQIASRHGDMPNLDVSQAAMSEAQQRLAVARQQVSTLTGNVRDMERLIGDVSAGRIAKCPTCGSEISTEDGRAHLASELDGLNGQLTVARGNIAPLERACDDAAKTVSLDKASLRTWHDDETSLASLRRERALVTDSIARSEGLLKDKEEALAHIANDAMDRSAEFALEDEIADLTDKTAREEQARSAFKAMSDARGKLGAVNASLADVNARIAARKSTLVGQKGIMKAFADAQGYRNACSRKYDAYQGRLSQLAEQRGKLASDIAACEDELKKAEQQAKDIAKLSEEVEVWTGVRAAIDSMRETLPQRITPTLSEEASRLLAIATGGTYSMLEIDDDYEPFIYTDEGRRPMSQMSGGEQDVASLCIRIAIAEAILESTGTPSQTLVLDEIFGALDDARKQEACDALRHLSDVLPRILCITHVEEIKDMADWTFVVEKDENGNSSVREITDTNVLKEIDTKEEQNG